MGAWRLNSGDALCVQFHDIIVQGDIERVLTRKQKMVYKSLESRHLTSYSRAIFL